MIIIDLKSIQLNNLVNDDVYEDNVLQFIENIYFMCNECNIDIKSKKKKLYISTLEKELGVSTGYISRIENSIKKSKSDPSIKPWNPSANFVLAVANYFQIYVDIMVNLDLSSITASEFQVVRLLSSLAKATYDNKLYWEITSFPTIKLSDIADFNPKTFESLTCTALLPNTSSQITIKKEKNTDDYCIFLTTSLGDRQEIYSQKTTSEAIKYAFIILSRSINCFFRSSLINRSQVKEIAKIAKKGEGAFVISQYRHIIQSPKKNNDIFIDKFTFFNNLAYHCFQKTYAKSFLEKQIGVSTGFISRAIKESYDVEPSFKIIYKSSKFLNEDIYSLCNLSCKDILDCEYHFVSFLQGIIINDLTNCMVGIWDKLSTYSNISIYKAIIPKTKQGIVIKYDKESDIYYFYMFDVSSDIAQLVAVIQKEHVYAHVVCKNLLDTIENSVNKIPSSNSIDESLKKSDKKTLNDVISSLW